MEIFWLLIIAVALFVAYIITNSKKGESRIEQSEQNTPNQGTIQAGNISLKYEVSAREKTASEEKSSELLKEATQKKNGKDLDGAIYCLQEAYKLMAQSSISYPVETFLRLPLYLQQADRYTESIVEFEKLLTNTPVKISKEFSHVSKWKQNGLASMEHATIFDKMRLAAQREKQFVSATYYQVLSDASRAVGLKLQKRTEEFNDHKDRSYWIDNIGSLLKKAKKETLIEDLTDKCMVFSRSCTTSALEELAIDIAQLLEISCSSQALTLPT